MTKAELVERIAKDADLSKSQAEKALKAFIGAVSATLAKGEKITLVGFGTFSVGMRAARKGKNPKTKEELNIPAKKVVKFKAGKALKGSL